MQLSALARIDFSRPLPILVWCVFCFLAISYHTNEVPPYHSDESYYVESVKNMVASGDYITPMYHDKKRFAKPILIYWLMAVPYKLFGFSPFVARMVSSLFAAMSVGLIYALGRRLFDAETAGVSALILPGLYMHFQIGRWATTDMALSFFILLAICFFVRGWKEPDKRVRNYLLAYLAMALGFLTKGPPALLLPGLAIIAFVLLSGNGGQFKPFVLAMGTTLFILVAAPWFVVLLSLHGKEFTDHFMSEEVHGRLMNKVPFSFYYVGVCIRYYLPWSLFFLAALWWVLGFAKAGTLQLWDRIKHKVAQLREAEQWPLLLCLCWFFTTLLVFTLLRLEHSRYILPASPAIALIIAHFLTRKVHYHVLRENIFRIPFFLTLVIYSLLAVGLAGALFIVNSLDPAPLRLILLPAILLAGVVALTLLYKGARKSQLIQTLALVQVVFLATLQGDVIPYMNQYPMKTFAKEIRQGGTEDERVGLFRLDNYRSKLEVLTAHAVYQVNNPAELNEWIDSDKKLFVAMRESDRDQFFAQKNLRVLEESGLWKKVRIQEVLKEMKLKDMKTILQERREKILLLTNR